MMGEAEEDSALGGIGETGQIDHDPNVAYSGCGVTKFNNVLQCGAVGADHNLF